jgi:hypothetical protein
MTSELTLVGVLSKKIEFWSNRYEFSFQFWGKNNCNVFISRQGVEIASFGGRDDIKEIFEDTISWCEKSMPGMKYPKKIVPEIDLPD